VTGRCPRGDDTLVIALALAAAGGLALDGCTSDVGDVAGAFNHLGNPAAVWCLAAFLAGRRPQRARAARRCRVRLPHLHDALSAGTAFYPGVWLTAALLARPMFAIAGAASAMATAAPRRSRRFAVFVAEARHLLEVPHQPGDAALMAGPDVLPPLASLTARLAGRRDPAAVVASATSRRVP
jgi:hypothetical protein